MREWLLLAASVVVTLAIGLAVLRWAAPELLGAPADLRIVQSSDEVVPFYELLFQDHGDSDLLLNDPYTLVRARPLAPAEREGAKGPTDLLGFRNLAVPNRTDVVAIGDSQTYGINVELSDSWPQRLALLARASVYSMATGGWGAVQYADMLVKAMAFEPRVAIVAFYSGNDPMESYRLAYGVERWAHLRPDPALTLDDRPLRGFAQRRAAWRADLSDGRSIAFTPWQRLYSIGSHRTIDAGWEIMTRAAREMARTARANEVALLFTIIPTKEFVYAERLAAEGSVVHADYARLVKLEGERITRFAQELVRLGGYVDLTAPLVESALQGVDTHPSHADGHPNAAGYARIAATLSPRVAAQLRSRPPRPGAAP